MTQDPVNAKESLGAGTPRDISNGSVYMSTPGLVLIHCHCLLRVTTHTHKEALFNRKKSLPMGVF